MAAMSSLKEAVRGQTTPREIDDLLRRHDKTLLRLAADSIDHGLREGRALAVTVENYAPELSDLGASFVTLKTGTSLRGCIGSALARRALVLDVATNAFAAAFNDGRFSPLEIHERRDLTISVSVLSAPQDMGFSGEAELISLLQPGIDGLIISDGAHSALFLPTVWKSLPDPHAFLEHLKRKAGLSSDPCSDSLTAQRFTATVVTLFADGIIAHSED